MKMKNKGFRTSLWTICLGLLASSACSTDIRPQTIAYGKEQGAYCRMTISDPRFAAQLISKKGRVYNFDDAHCLLAYIHEGNIAKEDIGAIYLADFYSEELKPAQELFYLKSESLNSPMQGNIAAFATREGIEKMISELAGQGSILRWEELWP